MTRPWAREILVLLLLVLITFGLTTPLRPAGALFTASFNGDGATTPWFHAFIADRLLDGVWPTTLTDFGYPRALPRDDAFATVVDALICAPTEVLAWPARWGWTLTLAAGINAIGVALLARAVGCGWIAAFVAGVLGAAFPPAWCEMAEGRTNTMMPGLPALALAATLSAVRRESAGGAAGWATLAGVGWAVAALAYPPWVLLWAPPATILLWRRPGRVWTLPLVAGVAACVGLPELWRIWLHPASHHARLDGLDPQRLVALTDLVRLSAPAAGLTFAWLPATTWALALPGLLRLRGALLLLYAAILGGAAAGPRALLAREPAQFLLDSPLGRGFYEVFLSRLHDLDRLVGVAGLVVILAAALGVDHLSSRGPRVARRAAWAVLLVPLLSAYLLCSVASRTAYHATWSPPATTTFLSTAAAGPAAELPWDQRVQFASAIAHHRPRANPLRPSDHPAPSEVFLVWLDALARGEVREPPPADAIPSSGLRWVLHDAHRCGGTRIPRGACGPEVTDALTRVLGVPLPVADGVLVWSVSP